MNSALRTRHSALRTRHLPIVVLLVALVAACAPPPSIQTPEGKKVWSANEVVIRINEFQEAVITAYDLGGLPKDTAEPLVTWTVRSLRTIQKLPDGWLQVVAQGWREVRHLVPDDPKLAPLVLVLNLALGG